MWELCSLSERAVPSEKILQTASKSAYKQQRNACSNHAPLERTALRTRSVTNKKTKKSIVPRRTMHTGRMSFHSTKKGVLFIYIYIILYKSVITMRSIFRKLCDRLFTICKISTSIFEPCGAIYRRICEIFSALQTASGPLTHNGNSVQIDA